MKKKHEGTPIVVIYTDKPKNACGVATVCIPGTKMGTSRTIQGIDLRVRAQAAGQAIAGIVANFIENNPHLENVTGSLDIEDRTYIYPAKPARKKATVTDEEIVERAELLEAAAELGITHSPLIGLVKLKEKVEAELKDREAKKAEESAKAEEAKNKEPVKPLVEGTPEALK